MFSLGSVSHGTLKTDDLLEAFAWELETRTRNSDKSTPAIREMIKEAHIYAQLIREEHLNDDGDEYASELVNDLADALNDLAPAYVYFGAHDGDGSDFGFWPAIDNLEADARMCEVLKVDDLSKVPADYVGGVMFVSDHGNVTFYSTNGQPYGFAGLVERWSCV